MDQDEPDRYPQYKQLTLAVILAAVKDANEGDPLAAFWLETTAPDLLDLCGVYADRQAIRAAGKRTYQENRARCAELDLFTRF